MARAQATDFLHSMRFHVVVDALGAGPGTGLLTPPSGGRTDAGFSAVGVPSASSEAVEYKEGHFIYSRKYPGAPSVEDITMSRGVARGDSSFWAWMRTVIEGSGEYRADLTIKHFHRVGALTRGGEEVNLTQISTERPARSYHIKEAFPTSHKVAADLDATTADISIMELSVTYEHFEVEEHTA